MSVNEKNAREIMVNICGTDDILSDYNVDLVDEGYIDSMAVLKVILDIESKLHIPLNVTDIKKENISTINNFIKFLDSISKK